MIQGTWVLGCLQVFLQLSVNIDSTVAVVVPCALCLAPFLNLPAGYGDDTIASCLKIVSVLVFTI